MAKSPRTADKSCRLYLITPTTLEGDTLPAFADTLAEALDAGDVACLQIRLKNPDETPAPDDAIGRVTEALLPAAHARDVAVIINLGPKSHMRVRCIKLRDNPLRGKDPLATFK